MKVGHSFFLVMMLLTLGACNGANGENSSAPVATYKVDVQQTYPHDRAAFTQGLLIQDGQLFESTGRNGQSTIRRVDLETGNILRAKSLPTRYFGEGIAAYDGMLYMLTWTSGEGFIFDAETLSRTGGFSFEGEGWGLTTDGADFYMSNGTDEIQVFEAPSFERKKTIKIRRSGNPVSNLNELEWIDGVIWANIWQSNEIVQINPANGRVIGSIDATNLAEIVDVPIPRDNVLNGIAYDASTGKIYLTGKKWPSLFEVDLVDTTASTE